MFLDEAVVIFKSGSGGNGIVAFRREKYVPKGGPAGGNGGRGGNIVLCTDPGIRTLVDFSNNKIYKAEDGLNGQNKNKYGKDGNDLIVRVPLGTIGYDELTGEKLFDLNKIGQHKILLYGGRGGKGNKAFSNSKNPTPHIAENGEPGSEKKVRLELQLLSDVGLVGKPSVGKSTLLSAISEAKAKIGDYDFTTLKPQLGLVKVGKNRSFVLADLPGLIKGASSGKGLGDRFLKHINRSKIILHLLDISKNSIESIYQDFLDINFELANYDVKLGNKINLVVVTKMDTEDSINKLVFLRNKLNLEKLYPISSKTLQGVEELKSAIIKVLDKEYKKINTELINETVTYNLQNFNTNKIKNNNFKIVKIDTKKYRIIDEEIEKKFLMTNNNYYESILKFTRYLHKRGVYKELDRMGITFDCEIYIGENLVDMLYNDY